jgi:thiamine-monophosphate kinase
MEKLSEMGEDALIARLIKGLNQGGNVLVGPGDDCAVVDVGLQGVYQLLKTDSLVEGIHYLSATPAEKVGWKAVARVLSDFAAMGGVPDQLLVTIALPSSQEVRYVEALYRGMEDCAVRYGAAICGGETSAVPDGSAAVISVAGTGWVEEKRLVKRRGGQVGDLVVVTGTLGGSIQGKHLDFTPRLKEAKWLTEHFSLHAMMDLSDGLARDLPRLAKASGCGYVIYENDLPCSPGCDIAGALGDGEDYELLFTVSPGTIKSLMSRWNAHFPELPLSVVGELIGGEGGALSGGWEHFSLRDQS